MKREEIEKLIEALEKAEWVVVPSDPIWITEDQMFRLLSLFRTKRS